MGVRYNCNVLNTSMINVSRDCDPRLDCQLCGNDLVLVEFSLLIRLFGCHMVIFLVLSIF